MSIIQNSTTALLAAHRQECSAQVDDHWGSGHDEMTHLPHMYPPRKMQKTVRYDQFSLPRGTVVQLPIHPTGGSPASQGSYTFTKTLLELNSRCRAERNTSRGAAILRVGTEMPVPHIVRMHYLCSCKVNVRVKGNVPSVYGLPAGKTSKNKLESRS